MNQRVEASTTELLSPSMARITPLFLSHRLSLSVSACRSAASSVRLSHCHLNATDVRHSAAETHFVLEVKGHIRRSSGAKKVWHCDSYTSCVQQKHCQLNVPAESEWKFSFCRRATHYNTWKYYNVDNAESLNYFKYLCAVRKFPPGQATLL